jgi:hypothetical protein
VDHEEADEEKEVSIMRGWILLDGEQEEVGNETVRRPRLPALR